MLEPLAQAHWKHLAAHVGRLVARRLPSPADVDDVVQEVLLRVWRHRSALRDNERFAAWLSRIAYTAAADHLRAQQRLRGRPAQPFAEVEVGATEPDSPGEEPDARQLVTMALRPFVQQLPPLYREAITWSELEGLPQAEVARRLGISVSAVKSRVRRGREQLRQDLERCCEIALDVRGTPLTCELRPDGRVPAGCCCVDDRAPHLGTARPPGQGEREPS